MPSPKKYSNRLSHTNRQSHTNRLTHIHICTYVKQMKTSTLIQSRTFLLHLGGSHHISGTKAHPPYKVATSHLTGQETKQEQN